MFTTTAGTTLPDNMMETTGTGGMESSTKPTKPPSARVVTSTDTTLSENMGTTTFMPAADTKATMPMNTETTLVDMRVGTETTLVEMNVDTETTLVDMDKTTTPIVDIMETTTPAGGNVETKPTSLDLDETTAAGGDMFDSSTTVMPDGEDRGMGGDDFTTSIMVDGDNGTTTFMPIIQTTTMPDLLGSTSPDGMPDNENNMTKTTPGSTIYDPENDTTPDTGDDMKSTDMPPVTFLTDTPPPVIGTETTMMPDMVDSTLMPDMSTPLGGLDNDTTSTTMDGQNVTSEKTTMGGQNVTSEKTTMGGQNVTSENTSDMTTIATDMPVETTEFIDNGMSTMTTTVAVPMDTSDIPSIPPTSMSKTDMTTHGDMSEKTTMMTSDIPSIPTTDSGDGMMTPVLTTGIPDIPTTPGELYATTTYYLAALQFLPILF